MIDNINNDPKDLQNDQEKINNQGNEKNLSQEEIEKIYNNDIVKHSLFTENNQWNRVSASDQGVPPKDEKVNIRQFPNPDSYAAFKVARYYQEIFKFLDENMNDLIEYEELLNGYNLYNWPVPQGNTVEEWAKQQFKYFDIYKKNGLDLVQFSKLLESLWQTKEQQKTISCQTGMNQAKSVFEKLFDFLDQNQDGLLDETNLMQGISYIANKDFSEDDLKEIFLKFDENKDGKINKEEFLLAAFNNMLTKSVEDKKTLNSFIE